MKRISSILTPIYKYVSPLGFPPLIAWVVWKLGAPFALAITVGASLAVYLVREAWHFADSVFDAGESLVVRRHGSEIVVPYAKVQAVRESPFRQPRTVTVEFKLAQPADKLVFLPRFNPLQVVGSSQVTRDLLWRAGLEKYR